MQLIISLILVTTNFLDKLKENKKYANLIALALIFIAGFRPEGIDRDYKEYAAAYLLTEFSTRIELSFTVISKVLRTFTESPIILFLLYALMGVTLKLYAIKKMSKFILLSICLYISHYYLLHEMTQIRIGVAAGFFLLSIHYKLRKDKNKFFLTSLLAILFHYSALMIIFVWLTEPLKKSILLKYALIPIGIIIAMLGMEILILIPIPILQEKVELYRELKRLGVAGVSELNLFNPIIILKIIIYYFLVLRLKRKNEVTNLLLFIFNLSIFSFYFFSFFPVAAFRISELFGIVEIILLPSLISTFQSKRQGKAIFTAICLSLISINLFYLKLIF